METSTILLRTLTGKSKIHFGKYENLTIDEIINLGHTAYLRQVYFNISSINFTDEILDRIHVFKKFRIEKPGINKKFANECFKNVFRASGDLHRQITSRVINKQYKFKFYDFKRVDRKKFSKIALQRINHGHTK